jgi:hypothetical protein
LLADRLILRAVLLNQLFDLILLRLGQIERSKGQPGKTAGAARPTRPAPPESSRTRPPGPPSLCERDPARE